MQKLLNLANAERAMQAAGLTQAAIAAALDISREAVSQWFNHKAFPRPNKLLQLGKLLNLALSDLVVSEEPNAPKVAFRKMKGTKTQNHHIEKARETGRYLRQLAPFLPFDTLEMPPVLKTPSCDYAYLQKAAAKVREDINLAPIDTVDFKHLIRRFRDLQAVVVPVMWGRKQRHENAVHIYLPDSQSTWVYLNLDTNIHDFKFWMAHELGHCLSPNLEGDAAEDFADAFAGSLLFPHEQAEQAYVSINCYCTPAGKISHIIDLAKNQTISPYTVLAQTNKYAEHLGQPAIDPGQGFNGAVTNFNKGYACVSKTLLAAAEWDGNDKPSAKDYIATVEQVFDTPFFDLLRRYYKHSGKGPGFIQTVLDVPLLDARSLHTELT